MGPFVMCYLRISRRCCMALLWWGIKHHSHCLVSNGTSFLRHQWKSAIGTEISGNHRHTHI